ncbi:MAG TPA: hypothetical protein VHQ47_12020 [Phycisphaerae bacterium]|jgi:hypothetical protein|nr:hypothetical protein [Phycisphaerae bacterium]
MRPLAIIFVLLSFTLIALGRSQVRAARRQGAAGVARRAGQNTIGWLLTLAGFLCMLAGVTLW